MKKCSQCQEEKSEDQFNFKNGIKKHSHCKQCQSNKVKKHYLANKEKYKIKARLNNKTYNQRNRNFCNNFKKIKGCFFCKESEPIALDFHHLESEFKENNVAVLVNSSSSIETISKEISKCVVLCSNCHRKLHGGLLNLPNNLS